MGVLNKYVGEKAGGDGVINGMKEGVIPLGGNAQ
jgi:hypothetical protein